jgi:hypothetical protein
MSTFSVKNRPSQSRAQAMKRAADSSHGSAGGKSWRDRLSGKWVTLPAAAVVTIFGTVAVDAATAGPAAAKMNQAATAFYDAVPGLIIHNLPIYRGTFTIVPKGSGTHITTLRWQNTYASNVCDQKVDFEAFTADWKSLWTSPGGPVVGCRHDYTANRGVNFSSAGATRVCGTLYFAQQGGGWLRKVQSCAIM